MIVIIKLSSVNRGWKRIKIILIRWTSPGMYTKFIIKYCDSQQEYCIWGLKIGIQVDP